jgi:hypothetical protein
MHFSIDGSRRNAAALLGAALAAASLVGVAVADDVSNGLDGSIDAVAEVMPLNSAGAAGITTLYVQPRNGDDKAGCNLTGSSTLSVSIASSNTSVATVSPSSATFESCGDVKTLTVTPGTVLTASTATISVSETGNTTGGTFDLAPATFTVTVTPPPNTAPSVSVAGVTGGASYDKGSVPVATCQVTDAEDGASSFPATLSAITGPYSSDGIGSQTASCSYTDSGGLVASASATYSIVDSSPPEITSVLSPASANGSNGWYTVDVGLDWTVSEPESPSSLATVGCVDQTITADQGPTDYTCSATSAGGSAGPETVTIKRDATPPTNVQFVGGPAAGASYFPTTVPAAPTCTADDATSGVIACQVSGYSTAVGAHTMLATATDDAGHTATAARSYSIRVLTLSGFFQPVDMGSVVNTVKNGSTVPLKFTVADEGVAQTATSIVSSFIARTASCEASTVTDEIELTTTGGTSLRYDTTAAQFIQNWQTPKKPGTCYVVTMTTIDGSSISAKFKLR